MCPTRANIIEESCLLLSSFSLELSLWSFLILWLPCKIDVEYADNQFIIYLVVCSTQGLCHSGMLSVFPPHYGIVNEMPMFGSLERRCIYDVLVQFCRRKTYSDLKVMLSTFSLERKTITVAVAYSY